MDPLTVAAAAGMRSRMESLDLLAHNLANSSTAGYKADREFLQLYRSAEATEGAGGQMPGTLPDIEDNWIDFSQGQLRLTGNSTDFALHGEGFFVVDAPGGPFYTRNGAFRISPKGVLETAEGYPVRAIRPDRQPGWIETDPADPAPLSQGADGKLIQGTRELGRLEIVNAPRQSVEKRGGNYFQILSPAGSGAGPAPASSAEVRQGALEASNSAPAESAVRLVDVMRQFEMLQRALTLGGEMNRKAIEEVGRV